MNPFSTVNMLINSGVQRRIVDIGNVIVIEALSAIRANRRFIGGQNLRHAPFSCRQTTPCQTLVCQYRLMSGEMQVISGDDLKWLLRGLAMG